MSVKIREKNGIIYLDIIQNRRHLWESLHLHVPKDNKGKKIYQLADIIRTKREMQIVSGEWGLLDSVNGKKTLIQYAGGLAEKKDKKAIL